MMESVKGLKKFFNPKMVSLLVLLVLIAGAFAIATKGTLFVKANIITIFNLMAITGLLTIGAGCLIVFGCIDLSSGATGTLCPIVMAMLLQSGVHWSIAVLACLALGMLIGAVNALLVNSVGFQPFIATMAVASIVNGLAFAVSRMQAIKINDVFIKYIGTERFFDYLPIPVLIMIVLFIVYGLMLSKSKFGRSVYLLGGNSKAARLSGLRPVRTSYILFMNAGMLSSLAGMLLASRLRSALTAGISASQFAGIIAAMLGGISFGGGTGTFAGAFIGLLIVTICNSGLTALGIISYWQTVASGVLLLLALTLDFLTNQRRARRLALGN